jgi:DNA-damage-inducible protein D
MSARRSNIAQRDFKAMSELLSSVMKFGSSTSSFERLKHYDDSDHEYWSARELMTLLEYTSWRSFKNVITKAKTACININQSTAEHFVDFMKITETGTNKKRKTADIHLSRFACYLIFQNADPAKPAVALAKTYIAMQTFKRETLDKMSNLELAASIFRDAQIEEKLRNQ